MNDMMQRVHNEAVRSTIMRVLAVAVAVATVAIVVYRW